MEHWTKELIFSINNLKENIQRDNILTRRQILSCVNGLYDPCGLISPFIVRANILLRKLWAKELKLEWDDPIPTKYYFDWNKFFSL